jgi:hypothetical protein
LSSLDKYDASKDLDKAAAHLALRMPYDTSDPNNIQHLKFDQLKEAVTLEYHKTQIGGFGTSASNLVESSSTGTAKNLSVSFQQSYRSVGRFKSMFINYTCSWRWI